MKRTHLVLFYAAGLLLALAGASFQHSPGYMDADYHAYVGQRLARGEGFSEEVLWNYLDDPGALPHPSNAYWPPLTSALAALGIWLLAGWPTFSAARLAFILIAAAVPPLTARLAYGLSSKRATAYLAGGLALLPAFYAPYLITTDSFSPTTFLGALFFLLLALENDHSLGLKHWLGLGLVAGLFHLTRAEGLIWLALALAAAWQSGCPAHSQLERRSSIIAVLGGYLLPMGPWMLRNLAAFGSPFGPGAGRSLWMLHYDELFTYPASQLTVERWLSSGGDAILGDRLAALGQNLSSTLAVQGEIFLLPLVLLAAWRLRSYMAVRQGAAAWLLLLIAMSILFPYSGPRGGFFHAGAALQPLIWALAAIGLDDFVEWGARQRGWNLVMAGRIFRGAALLFAALLSLFIFTQRAIGSDAAAPAWDASAVHYNKLGEALRRHGYMEGDLVMVNNPPGFALAVSEEAIAIPNGGLQASRQAATQFGARFFLLEANHPQALQNLYENPLSAKEFEFLETVDSTHLFLIGSQANTSP